MEISYNEACSQIDDQAKSFKYFLRDFLLDKDSWIVLNQIAQQTKVYIFSGVIRNFLLGEYRNRDLDIVLENIDGINLPLSYLRKSHIFKNSFGGFKIRIENLMIDVWGLSHTWGLSQENLPFTPENLIHTAFFNFSSIAYDFNNKCFIYDYPFIDFFIHRYMDVVFEPNPNTELCIVSTMHYYLSNGFPIKPRLQDWIKEHYIDTMTFERTQMAHFNKILYTDTQIKEFVSEVIEFREAHLHES